MRQILLQMLKKYAEATKKTLKVVSITVEKITSETGETQAQILKWLKNNFGDVHD